jgi:predicted TIM-barrel fold metal-dependent hydrolase
MLIDAHIHVWARENLPDGDRWAFARRAARSRLPFRNPEDIFPRVGVGAWDPEGEEMIRIMDDIGIDKVIDHVCDFGPGFGNEASWSFEEIQEHAHTLIGKYPDRYYPLCGVDPRRYNAVQLLERSVLEWGAVGWQCFPANGYRPDDPMCFPLYQKCQELGVPVVIRTGNGDIVPDTVSSNPLYVEPVARLFPELNLILAHSGGGIDGHWREAVMVASVNPTIHLQLSLWQNGLFATERAPDRIGEFLRILSTMVTRVGAHRILWGTDFARGSDMDVNKKWANLFLNLPEEAKEYKFLFSDEERDLMCYANSQRLFKL